ncbi:Aldehyde dehydrogenase family 2 member C4 [Hibiscus syriacus]|uniref:Aldehyde dehydrogenase family 2 member C4 n=1 Tax=Hibiscus syriacus TaxID=106335 RepID=A0A6A3B8A4_HIBSY|nr:Aldehyde dehydrogenase family 2 member C4 [Hibiscus syriacus]
MANHSNGSSNFPPIRFTKLFINGHFVDSISGKTMETMDPRTGDVINRVSAADIEYVDLAVKAARHAFDHGPWPRFSGSERGRLMMKLADMIKENVEEIAALDAINGGKLLSLCKFVDVPVADNTLRYYAGAADKIHGTVLKLSKGLQGYTLREPIGVVGCIIPWNFPSIMFSGYSEVDLMMWRLLVVASLDGRLEHSAVRLDIVGLNCSAMAVAADVHIWLGTRKPRGGDG